jgi:small subunit ribosomal protein S1
MEYMEQRSTVGASNGQGGAVNTMEEWMTGDFGYRSLKRGDVVDGIIVQVGEDEVLVDIGAKSEGIVPAREIERLAPQEIENLHVGMTVRTVILTTEDKDGNIILSLTQAEVDRDWEDAEKKMESGEIFESSVTNHNKGGVIVPFGRLRGFIPASQLTRARRKGDDANGQSLVGLVGTKLWLKVIEVDRGHNRLILSEQAAMRQRNKVLKERLLVELKEGDKVTGEVISLADFGAFVNLGGADGLIHLSELSWRRVNHPSEVLKVGDEVEVQVLNVDRERRRIGLSLKRLQPEPWSQIENQFQLGQVVKGTITKLASFGAFARLEGDTKGEMEGLIHLSELADKPVQHPREVVKEGDPVEVRIIRVDAARKRMGLSMRRINDPDFKIDETPAQAEAQAEA